MSWLFPCPAVSTPIIIFCRGSFSNLLMVTPDPLLALIHYSHSFLDDVSKNAQLFTLLCCLRSFNGCVWVLGESPNPLESLYTFILKRFIECLLCSRHCCKHWIQKWRQKFLLLRRLYGLYSNGDRERNKHNNKSIYCYRKINTVDNNKGGEEERGGWRNCQMPPGRQKCTSLRTTDL